MKLNLFAGARKRQAHAYTLVEVVVAVLVVAITGLSLYVALCTGFGMMGMTREKLRGTQIMLRKSEALRLCSWDQLRSLSFTSWSDPTSVATNGGGILYSGTVVTNSAMSIVGNTTYATNMRLVTISVVWTNHTMGKSLVRSNQMQTFVAQRGMQNYVWGP